MATPTAAELKATLAPLADGLVAAVAALDRVEDIERAVGEQQAKLTSLQGQTASAERNHALTQARLAADAARSMEIRRAEVARVEQDLAKAKAALETTRQQAQDEQRIRRAEAEAWQQGKAEKKAAIDKEVADHRAVAEQRQAEVRARTAEVEAALRQAEEKLAEVQRARRAEAQRLEAAAQAART